MQQHINVLHKQVDNVIDDDKCLYKELGLFGLIGYGYNDTNSSTNTPADVSFATSPTGPISTSNAASPANFQTAGRRVSHTASSGNTQ